MERSEEKSLMQHVFSIMFNNIFLFFSPRSVSLSHAFLSPDDVKFPSRLTLRKFQKQKKTSEEKFLPNKIAHCYDFSSFGP